MWIGRPTAGRPNICGIEQLLGPQQHPVAHLEHRIDQARVEFYHSACAATSSPGTVVSVVGILFA